jgi:hypothetical protein
MMPFTAQDLVRLVAADAHSARPTARVRPESDTRPSSPRFAGVRFGLGATLRRLADRVEPARQVVPAS